MPKETYQKNGSNKKMNIPTPPEKEEMIRAAKKMLEFAESLPTATPCTRCDHFRKIFYCGRYEQDIPKENQAQGCQEWIDEIPF